MCPTENTYILIAVIINPLSLYVFFSTPLLIWKHLVLYFSLSFFVHLRDVFFSIPLSVHLFYIQISSSLDLFINKLPNYYIPTWEEETKFHPPPQKNKMCFCKDVQGAKS
jgi:hypothetical protein